MHSRPSCIHKRFGHTTVLVGTMDSKVIRDTLLRLRAEKRRIELAIAAVEQQMPGHISVENLERYHLGDVSDEAELAPLEEHLLWCASCVGRAEETAAYIESIKAAAFRLVQGEESRADAPAPESSAPQPHPGSSAASEA
jgi:hypothetical protein